MNTTRAQIGIALLLVLQLAALLFQGAILVEHLRNTDDRLARIERQLDQLTAIHR